jgi:TolB-like protein
MLDLRAIGVDPGIAARIPDLVAQTLSHRPGYELVSRRDLQNILDDERTRQRKGCTQDEACVAQLAQKLQADLVLSGSIGQVGSSYLLTLVVTDPAQMGSARRVEEAVKQEQDLPAAVNACVGKLFDPQSVGAGFHLPEGRKLSFAVFDLKPSGLSPDVAQNLTQVLSVEVKGVEGSTVVSREDIFAMLRLLQVKMQVGCSDDGCMTQIAGALGVDRLITGDAGKVGSTFLINLRLIDARSGLVENRVLERFEGDEDELLRAVRHAARNLLGLNEQGAGRLAVTASQNAADVYVDELRRGKAPLPVESLTVGRHAVRVSQRGFFDWHGDVYIDPSETTAIWANLSPQPQAWYEKWWVWTIAGAIVAGATTTAIVTTRPSARTVSGTVEFPTPAAARAP